MTILDLERRLRGLEDRINFRLGYRPFEVSVGAVKLDPPPEVKETSLRGYSDSQMRGFIDSLGGRGNPISWYEAWPVAGLTSEDLIRSYDYWTLTRDSLTAECLPVSVEYREGRFKVILAVLKHVTP